MSKGSPSGAILATTVLLVLVNLVPVVGVLFWDWSVYTLFILFWAENLIVGFFNVARFLVLWRFRNDSKMILMIPFFCLHYGGFMLGHLIFLILLFRPEGEPLLPLAALWIPFLALAVSHGVSFLTHFIGQGEYREAKPDRLMTLPYARVLVLHLTILVGGIITIFLGEPLAALLVLVGAKILVDVVAHRREHRRKLAQTRNSGDGSGGRDPDFPGWDDRTDEPTEKGAAPETDDLMQVARNELGTLNAEHDGFRRIAWRDIAILAAAALILAGVLVALTELPLAAGLGSGAVVVAVLAIFRVQQLHQRWNKQVIDQLLPALSKQAGAMQYSPAMQRRFLKPFGKLELIDANRARSRFGPFFKGHHAGTDFECGQVMLSRGGKDSEDLLDSMLFRIRLPFHVEDRVLVTGKSMFSGKLHMVNVDLGDETFHDIFAVHVNQDHADPERLARSLLNSDWRRALWAVNHSQSGGAGRYVAVQAGFMHDSLYLTLRRIEAQPVGQTGKFVHRPGRPFFKVSLKLFAEPKLEADLRHVVDDLLIVHRIIDKLPLARPMQGSETP